MKSKAFRLLALSVLALTLQGCCGRSICDLRPCLPEICCNDWGPRPCVIEECCEVAFDFDCECRKDDCSVCCPDQPVCGDFEIKNPIPQCSSIPYCPRKALGEKGYRISSGDVLEIATYGDSESIVEQVKVAPDGKVYFSFFKGIQAEGKTLEQLKEEVKEKMSTVFLAPSVTISPIESIGESFTVLGRVKSPGRYPLQSSTSLRQAIGVAGGLLSDRDGGFDNSRRNIQGRTTRSGGRGFYGLSRSYGSQTTFTGGGLGTSFPSAANLKNSFIVRDGRKLDVDFEKLIFTADASSDITLQAGDYIYIADDYKKDVFVLGAVNGPQALPYEDGLTLMGAMTGVGGWRMGGPYGADMRKVLILRGDLECPDVICVDLCMILGGCGRDVLLQPGDIVYVYNKHFRFGRELVRLAISSFVLSFSSNYGEYVIDKYILDNID